MFLEHLEYMYGDLSWQYLYFFYSKNNKEIGINASILPKKTLMQVFYNVQG